MGTIGKKVVARFLRAMDFPTKDALDAYLKEHPGADRSNHHVVAPDTKPDSPKSEEPKKKHRRGRGPSKGKLELPDFDPKVRATILEHTEKVSQDANPPEGRSAKLAKLTGQAQTAKSMQEWSNAWVGGTNGVISVTAGKDVDAFMKSLDDPKGWARLKYETTQALLDRMIKEREILIDSDGCLTLYRGVAGVQAREIRAQHSKRGGAVEAEVGCREISSWTESYATAKTFTDNYDVVLKCKIHHTRVAAMWNGESPKWNENDENEFVVITPESGKFDVTVGDSKVWKKTAAGTIVLDDQNENWLRILRAKGRPSR